MAPCGNESCCERPVLSWILAALTLATFLGAFLFAGYAGEEKSCYCESGQCCIESTSDDPCADDECYCPFELSTGNDICRRKEEELSDTEGMIVLVLLMIGVGLAVAAA